jgi:hypothetical protein
VPGTLALEVLACNIAKFLVDQRNQRFKSFLVTGLPALE